MGTHRTNVDEAGQKYPADVRSVRKRLGLSQRALALSAGIDQGNLSKMESGERAIPDDAADKLAAVLGTDSLNLIMANRALAAEKAMSEGDAIGVLKAIEALVEITDELLTLPMR